MADSKQSRLMNAFRDFDTDRNGSISQSELRIILVKLGVSDGDVTKVFSAMDANKDGQVDYNEFVNWLYSADGDGAALASYVNRTEKPEEALDDFFDYLKKLKAQTMQSSKGKEQLRFKKLKDIFDAIDLNGNGKVSMLEFKAGMTSLGHVCDDAMLEEIFDLIDTERVAQKSIKPYTPEQQAAMIAKAQQKGEEPPEFSPEGFLHGDVAQFMGANVAATKYEGNDDSKKGRNVYDPKAEKKKDHQISFKEFKKAFDAQK